MSEDKELLAELQAELKEQGVEATVEEIGSAVDALQKSELMEEDLESVAGGRLILPPLLPLPMLLTICPRCRKVYIRSKGHRCKRSGGGYHA